MAMPTPNKPVVTYADINAVTISYINRHMWSWGYAEESNDSQPAPAPLDTIIPGYIEAWRWWEVGTDGMETRPTSTSDDHIYKWSGENIADMPPREWNTNGFYCYKPVGIQDHAADLFSRVAIYGDMVECEYGYRAEKLRILDVWVDVDLKQSDPEAFDTLMAIPQVKGTFDTSDGRIVDIYGNIGDHQCLTLENHKELSGTSLLGGRTTMMVIDRVGHQTQSPMYNDLSSLSRNLYTLGLASVIAAPTKEWVVKPEGKYCDFCDRLIADDEVVVVNWDMTSDGDLTTLVLNHQFHWDVKWRHLECLTRKSGWYMLGVDWGSGGDSTVVALANNADPFAWPMADEVFQMTPLVPINHPVMIKLEGLSI